ncbi:hypothetical protein BSL78_14717 [Apostichopus japonicus]|uniref:Uncharacterized protein n=1 Tax=Stichopus japonicus TaxID=307972 RepID=A0A2G8KK84_STIJA|nr:hypothetical protein BSL78_14717 [Apostichopus japonicus]
MGCNPKYPYKYEISYRSQNFSSVTTILNQSQQEYKFTDLEPGSSYIFYLRLTNYAGRSGPYADIECNTTVTADLLPFVLGVTCPSVFLIISLLVLVVYLIASPSRRSNLLSILSNKYWAIRRERIEDDNGFIEEEHSEMRTFERDQQIPNICSSRGKTIHRHELPSYVKEQHLKGGFHDEYKELIQGKYTSCSVAEAKINERKNRFQNIITYDHSRVVLPLVNGDSSSDYINASYIHMKCLTYWPDTDGAPQQYSNISVEKTGETASINLIIRRFKLQLGPSIHEVTQYHYFGWPDMKVPQSADILWDIIDEVEKDEDENSPPIVVHCRCATENQQHRSGGRREFVYLGDKVSKDGGGTEDIKNKIGKARSAFRNLGKIWTNGAIGRKTKLTLFKTLLRSVLLYGSEAWKVTKREEQKLDAFQFKDIRRILKIPWTELVSNDRIMQQIGINRISVEIRRRRWNWIGHIMRKETGNHARVAMEWAPEGRRKVGRPKTTWRRTATKERDKNGWRSWSHVRRAAEDRQGWKDSILTLCNRRYGED